MAVAPLGLSFAVLAAVALAVQSHAVRLSTRSVAVVDLVAAIFVGNLLVLVPVTALRYGTELGLTAVAIGAFAVAGVLGSLLARAALFVGIDRLGASRAESLKSTFPLVAVGIGVLWFGERPTAALLGGVALIVVGAVAVSWESRTAAEASTHVDRGLQFPLAAAFLLGIDPVFTKIGLAEGTPALVGVTVRVLAAAAGFGCYLLWRRYRLGPRQRVSPTRWVVVASLANTLYLVAYLAALAHAPISVVTPVIGASPLLVLVASATLVRGGERVTARLALGVTVLVVGVALVLQG